MRINTLTIDSFRNLRHCTLNTCDKFNLFHGDNAAGKTSILEAIYTLSCAKSFRSRSSEALITQNEACFSLFARLTDKEGATVPVGLSKSRDGKRVIRVNEANQPSISAITQHLAIQFIGSSSYTILTDGPKSRRQLINWGLFHTNPVFYITWKNFHKLLTQRNAALKNQRPRHEILSWDAAFIESALAVHQLRCDYVSVFSHFFNKIIAQLLPNVSVTLTYSSGWHESQTLESHLSENFQREMHLGYTLSGPHRADLLISFEDTPVSDILSQGQQKLVSYALSLAQGLHLQEYTNKSPIYLIDDLPSELDPDKRHRIVKLLSEIDAQIFITGIERWQFEHLDFSNKAINMFHVKHGGIIQEEFITTTD